MSKRQIIECDWCSLQLENAASFQTEGWRNVDGGVLRAEHLCPACIKALTQALKLVMAQRRAEHTGKPVDINKAEP